MTFKEWFNEQEENGFYHDFYGAEAGFDAGVQIERERIRARAKIAAEKTFKAGGYYVGPQHYLIEQFVEELLREDGDEHP